MEDFNSLEKNIKETYHLADVSPTFITDLANQLKNTQTYRKKTTRSPFLVSKRWGYAVIVVLAILSTLFAIGPSKVLAQIQSILGYIPGIGVVDTRTTFYQLSDSVYKTRDDITLTIQSALISADQIIISFSMTDLPEAMTPEYFYDPQCNTPAYMILPDNSVIQSYRNRTSITPDSGYEHNLYFKNSSTTSFTRATLVFPCLMGTIPNTGPTNWQFDLTFKPAPDNLTVFPVALLDQDNIETEITDENAPDASEDSIPDEIEGSMPALIVDGDRQEEMIVLSVVEKPDSYWITWAFPFAHDSDIQVNGHLYLIPFNPILFDANGEELPKPDQALQNELRAFTDSIVRQLPEEKKLDYFGTSNTFAIPKSGIQFPVYLKLNVFERSFPEKESYAEITFNGTHVLHADGPMEINQEINIGSVSFTLVSIEMNEFGGYSFNFNGEEHRVVQCKVEIPGLSPNLSGDGNLYPGDLFNYFNVLVFPSAPTGQRTLRISEPAVLGDLISFIGIWSPEN